MSHNHDILLYQLFLLCSLPIAKTGMAAIRRKMSSVMGESAAYALDRVFKTVVVLVLFALCTVRLVGDSYNPFIYFKF